MDRRRGRWWLDSRRDDATRRHEKNGGTREMGNGRGHPVASSFDRKAGIEECATPSAVNFCVLSNTGNSSVPLGTSSTDPLCVPCCATYSPIPSPRDRYYHSVDLNVYTCARIKVKVYVCVSKNKRVFEKVERSNAMAWRRKGKGRGSDGEGRKVGYIDNRFSRNRVDRPDTALLFYQSIYVYIYIYIIQSFNLSQSIRILHVSFFPFLDIISRQIVNQLSFEFRLIG